MELNEVKQRLELALRPAEEPTIEEVLEEVSRHGILRGPVDWVFPAWMLYVEYATQKIAEAFQLTEEEKRQLLRFRDAMKKLLLETQKQAKAKLTSIYRAITEDAYRLEGRRLYAPDNWMYVGRTMYIPIHGVSAVTHFPDVLKLPCERLELFQLGWRASDEGEAHSRPFMDTVQPWQVFAWATVRCGKLYIRIDSANLTREGVSINVCIRAKSWKQKWSKDEAISLVVENFRRGEWAPLFTMWLGDGKVKRKGMLSSKYELVITTKEPWRLGLVVNTYEALVATGREAFVKLREAAGVYGELLDLLKAHKWIYIKLATEDGFRAALKQNKNSITVAGVVMHLRLVSGRGGSLLAEHYTRDAGKALKVADKLKTAGLRPNVVMSNANYVVYITTADLLRLAERDETIRKAIALYLTEEAKNGTPRQREIAEKILKRNPLFSNTVAEGRHLKLIINKDVETTEADIELTR
ncbi:MAG: hypothetical protein LM562_03390 [Pyrobaculum sp.]|nr:hypothetical protein [Pyrobaculum sp.]